MDDAWNLDVHVNLEDSLFRSFMNFLLMDRNTPGLNTPTKHLKTYYSICFNKYPLGYIRTPRKWSRIYNKTLSFHFYKFYFRIIRFKRFNDQTDNFLPKNFEKLFHLFGSIFKWYFSNDF